MDGEMEASEIRALLRHSACFLAAGLFVFLLGLTFAPALPPQLRSFTQALVLLVPVTATLAFRVSKEFRAYSEVAFVYFVAAVALFTAGFVGDWTLALSGNPLESPAGFAALKLGEDLAIVVTIVALILLIRRRLSSLFLTKGNLRLGLIVGLFSFAGLTILGLAITSASGVPWDRILVLLPIFGSVVIADGITEELLFRGLFLKRLEPFLGPRWANIVTAAVFSLAHLQVEFAPSVPVFLVVVFLLGVLWGWIMQRTGSLLAPALFHAGADMLIISQAFAAFGVQV